MIRSFCISLGVMLVLLCIGCASSSQFINLNGSPLTSSGMEATEFREFYGIMNPPRIIWQSDRGKRIRADRITRRSEKYLDDQGRFLEPRLMTPPLPYIHSFFERIGDPVIPVRVIPELKTIICIDPPIVVISEGSIRKHTVTWWRTARMSLHQEQFPEEYGSPDDIPPKWRTRLKRGYLSGTRIPYCENLEWFSSKLRVGPIPLERISDDIRNISVPWGTIVLTHEGDEWIVTGRVRDE